MIFFFKYSKNSKKYLNHLFLWSFSFWKPLVETWAKLAFLRLTAVLIACSRRTWHLHGCPLCSSVEPSLQRVVRKHLQINCPGGHPIRMSQVWPLTQCFSVCTHSLKKNHWFTWDWVSNQRWYVSAFSTTASTGWWDEGDSSSTAHTMRRPTQTMKRTKSLVVLVLPQSWTRSGH